MKTAVVALEKTLNLIRIYRNKRINEIEKIVGADFIKTALIELANKGFTCNAISKMIGKERHIINKWYKRYKIIPFRYSGFKPFLLKVTLNKNEHNIKYGRYEKINNKEYKVFYVYPNPILAYVIGLILGDGHIDKRKIYITGGKPTKSYTFLKSICKKISKVSKYLGNKTIRVKYYDKYDNEVKCNNSKIAYWRLYIYWSALSHALKNKYILNEILTKIWSKKVLLNAFSAGLLDTDGYFTFRNKKPERIGIDQTIEKWWFPLFVSKFKEKYLVKMTRRSRRYRIEHRKRLYEGTSTSNVLELRMSSWPVFIDKVVLPYSNKPIHLRRAPIFKNHSINVSNRWRYK